jgi:hypothetical protein
VAFSTISFISGNLRSTCVACQIPAAPKNVSV